jgi:hypothetical protein
VVDPRPEPKLKTGDVAIAFTIDQAEPAPATPPPSKAKGSSKKDNDDFGDEMDPFGSGPDPSLETASSVQNQTKNGVVTFWLPLPSNFDEANADASKPTPYERLDGETRSLSGSDSFDHEPSDSEVPLLSTKDESFVSALGTGSGTEITYGNGIGLTNRYLAQGDNAQFFLETLKAYAPNAKRVVFTEGTFGQVQPPGLLETMGPWAEGAWYQILFVFAVIVWTLNRRFGLPQQVRRRQTGGRELVDAFTDTMYRAKATSLSLENTLLLTDLRLRSLLKLRRDATEAERDAQLTPKLRTTLSEVRAAAVMKKVRPNDALRLVVSLERQLQGLNSERQAVATDPRKRSRNLL